MLHPKPMALLLAGLVALAPLSAQAEKSRRLSVTGEASKEVVPDTAVISLGVRAQSDEAGEAMELVSVSMNEVMASLQDSGIAGDDIQTQQISMHPVWSEIRRDGAYEQTITGFEASNIVMVTLDDLGTMGGVLDDVLRAGANEFRGISFSYSEQDAAEDDLRSAAVEDAIDKARQLAAAAGMELGLVRQIQDGAADGGGGRMMATEMARSSDMPIAPGAITLRHSVSMIFDLKKPSKPK
ncbi:SIMPL domain-containing protein [Tritonibacter horizontis]|uniref:26 kDa periplasmic immunogenic protein n=1 Tax=Tritonibacter horizontis TaxID=1768241 RepID=A0A132C0C6_9RHOB|nr:SIMPL domain-containing protein [Tritonibacter horizontis]KUP94029.1 26 kDa periplasmic immunogenic protein precursor [Tritonibacter horizontis]